MTIKNFDNALQHAKNRVRLMTTAEVKQRLASHGDVSPADPFWQTFHKSIAISAVHADIRDETTPVSSPEIEAQEFSLQLTGKFLNFYGLGLSEPCAQ